MTNLLFCERIKNRLERDQDFYNIVTNFINSNFDLTYVYKIPKIGLYFDSYDDALNKMNEIKKNQLKYNIDYNGKYGIHLFLKKNKNNERKYKILFEYKKRNVPIAIFKQTVQTFDQHYQIYQTQPLELNEKLKNYGINDNTELSLLIATYLRLIGCIFVCYDEVESIRYVYLNSAKSFIKDDFNISKNFKTSFFY